jgi:hypothetical protein
MDSIAEKRQNRFQLLKWLYDLAGGNSQKIVSMPEAGVYAGLSNADAAEAMTYLHNEGLAEHKAFGGRVVITHRGVKEIEDALATPQQPTTYFPPASNVIHIHSMVGSQIQQRTVGSNQQQTVSMPDAAATKALMEEFRRALAELPLGANHAAEADAEISTIDAQLRSTKPKPAIIRESLKTLRSLLEGVASNVVAAKLIVSIGTLLGVPR